MESRGQISRITWVSRFCMVAWLGILSACSTVVSSPTVASTEPPPARTPTENPLPAASATSSPAVTLTSITPLEMGTLKVCSPLAGYSLEELPELVSNPYHPPKPGSDDPHQGVDLADRQPGTNIALAGRNVQAAFSGKVAMLLQDRFPYGNAILVETPLDGLEAGTNLDLLIPTAAPTLETIPVLTCPTPTVDTLWDTSNRSLYVLYAHLESKLDLKVGDPITCGQPLGAVGATGNALNPHLHLEIRTGPAGVSFDSMAHYDASASVDEMANYCTWRVSGLFQMLDPLVVIQAKGVR